MDSQALAGPAGNAQWEDRQVGGGFARPLTLKLLPDAASNLSETVGRSTVYYYVPKVPQLLRDATGNPTFSLTLVLSRQPDAGDQTIYPLIQQGLLGLSLTLGVSDGLLAGLAATTQAEYKPLFVHEVMFSLEADRDNTTGSLVSASASGPSANAALSVTLDRDQVLGVLSALDGAASDLTVRASILYRTAAIDQVIHLTGSWAAIFDYIHAHLGTDDMVSLADLRQDFADMLKANIVSADQISPSGVELPLKYADSGALFSAFMRVASFIIQRETPMLELEDPANRYSLRRQPHLMMRLDLKQTFSSPEEKSLELVASLEEVIGGALDNLDRSRFISLIGPTNGSATGFGPVPRLVRTQRGFRGSQGDAYHVQLAATGSSITSLALALTPDTSAAPTAQELIRSDFIHGGGKLDWMADDLVIHPPLGQPIYSFPVVDDPSAALWHDRLKPSRYWYTPSFVVVQPPPNQDPAASPFLFTFSQTGVTGGGTPAPGLSGTVRFTLQQVMSDATKTALQSLGNPEAHPVLLSNLSVLLELPFLDKETHTTRIQLFSASVEQNGDSISATVEVLDEWVKLCYGALAYPGFQSQPARLSIAYAYRAYVPVTDDETSVVFGGKIARIPIITSPTEIPHKITTPVFNAAANTFYLPTGVLQFQHEAVLSTHPGVLSTVSTVRRASEVTGAVSTVKNKPPSSIGGTRLLNRPLTGAPAIVAPVHVTAVTATLAGTIAPQPILQHAAVIPRPDLTLSPVLATVINQTRYATQTLVHQVSLDVLYPCETLGAFYTQSSANGQTTIGCQDALRLGEISYKQFAEITELRHSLYGVYRSLQQPGRFLIVPTTYRITRYSPKEPDDKAYRPVIMIYSIIDDAVPANNRYFITGALQPDIPYYARRELEVKLAAYTPFGHTPMLVYPTDPTVQSQATYGWALPDGIEKPDVLQVGDTFQVSISTHLVNALALTTMIETSGVSGKATFTLPDSLIVMSGLALDTNITGPWANGPIEVSLSAGNATLTNKIEQTVNVFDLVTRTGSNPGQTVKVDLSLAPNASQQVALAGAVDEAYPVYSIAPGHVTLKELPIFVEDVTTDVIFINLVSYANHGLTKLQVQARLKDTQHVYPVDIDEGQNAQVEMTLSLMTYLETQILQFQVTKKFSNNQVGTTAWLEWNLQTQGVAVSITWELIQ